MPPAPVTEAPGPQRSHAPAAERSLPVLTPTLQRRLRRALQRLTTLSPALAARSGSAWPSTPQLTLPVRLVHGAEEHFMPVHQRLRLASALPACAA